jgi:flagellin
MAIQHNLLAMNGNRQLGISSGATKKSMEKIGSGYRINRAADDAAGLSISEKMRWQVRGLSRASQNAEEGISLIQTAEGALSEVHEMLQRMRELAVQAANDTNQDIDRDAIQEEITALRYEVDRISATTQYNKMNLLDGTLAMSSAVAVSDPLMVTDEYVAEKTPVGQNFDRRNEPFMVQLDTEIVPQAVNALLNTFSSTFGEFASSEVGIGLNLSYLPASTALASVSVMYRRSGDDISLQYQLTVNHAWLRFDDTGKLKPEYREGLEGTILHEMVHALMDEVLTNGMIGLRDGMGDASNAFPGWFKEGMAQTAVGGYANYNDWVNGNGGLGITSDLTVGEISNKLRSNELKLSSGTAESKYGTGYLACMYLGYLLGGDLSASSIGRGLDTLLNRIKNGESLDAVIADATNYAGLDDFTARFGDTESSAFVGLLSAAVGEGNGSVVGGNYLLTDLLPDSPSSTTFMDLDIDYTWVQNSYTPESGRNQNDGGAYAGGTGQPNQPDPPDPPDPPGPNPPDPPDPPGPNPPDPPDPPGPNPPGPSGVAGTSHGGFHLQVGALSGQALLININRIDAGSLGITDLNMGSFMTATTAIGVLDSAINIVSSERTKLGAYQNRLEHTILNLDVVSENTQASESLIRDADMPKEMVEYSKNNILMQAGQAMLAQAN